MLLKNDKTVKDIKLQPEFIIIDSFKVECGKCGGRGQVFNQKTGNFNKCRTCKGRGKREKGEATYTADFLVDYIDGHSEVIDVKGGKSTRTEAFGLRRKLFEKKTGRELVVVSKTEEGWKRK